MFAALLVLFASRELGLSSGLIGLALGIGAVGGLVGAVAAGPLSRGIGVGPSIVVGAIVFPAAIALTAVADGPVWLRAGLLGLSELVSGIGVMYLDVNSNALTATVVPDGLRSRVSGAYAAVNYGMRPLGALTGGALGTWLGIRPTLWVAAVGGTLGVLWLLPSPIPRIRTLDGLSPEPVRTGRRLGGMSDPSDPVPSLFEWAGGQRRHASADRRLLRPGGGRRPARAVLPGRRVRGAPRPRRRVVVEVLGGPDDYTGEHGGYETMLAHHRGLAITPSSDAGSRRR